MRAAVFAVLVMASAPSFANEISFPGGVADLRGQTAFVDADAGGVEAIALASGATRWRAPSVARPMALSGQRLLALAPSAQRNELRFAVVDTSSGRILSTSRAVTLPTWVSVAPLWAHHFDCHAIVDREKARVTWHATAAWSQGMHPQEGQEAAARHDQTGEIEIDFADGRVDADAKFPSHPAASPPTPPGTTLDGHHVIERDGTRWRVLDAASGKPIATLTLAEGFREPTVIGERLYVVRDAQGLEAIGLSDGNVRWRRARPRPSRLAAPQ